MVVWAVVGIVILPRRRCKKLSLIIRRNSVRGILGLEKI